MRGGDFAALVVELVAHGGDDLGNTVAFAVLEAVEDVNRAPAGGNQTSRMHSSLWAPHTAWLKHERITTTVAAVRTPVRIRRADATTDGSLGEDLVIIPDETAVILDTAAAAADGNVDEDAGRIDIQEGAGDEIVGSAVALAAVVALQRIAIERGGGDGGGGPALGVTAGIVEVSGNNDTRKRHVV